MEDDQGLPPMIIDNEEEFVADQDDYALYTKMQQEQERSNVTYISGGKVVPHTDDELIPVSPIDIIYDKFVFDAEQSLKDSLSQRWLIDGIIPADGFGVLYGKSGSYKSFMALDLAAAISSGSKQWHGFDVDTPGPVLYIAAEGAQGLKERAVAWEKHYGKKCGQLAILTMPITLDDLVMTQQFVEAAMRAEQRFGKPFRMVVIDTMARSFNGDENSSKDIGAFINSCYSWRSKLGDCTVMVVTHSGKDATRGIRGSSATYAASDFVYVVSRPNNLQALMKNEKQKDIDEAEDMRFALQSVDLGMLDRKGRKRMSLVPILESQGEMADPDAEEDSVFNVKDVRVLVGMVRAAEAKGKQMTEDELRTEFRESRESEGISKDASRMSFRRSLTKAIENGSLFKHGSKISIPK